jgi:hypothetical protein
MNIALLDNPLPLLPFFARFPFPCVINHPFTYLEIPFLVIVVRMSIHTRPWLVIDCSPLAPYPPPPLPTAPTVHVTCFQRWHHNISYIVWHSSSILILFFILSLTYFKKEKKMVLGPFGRENMKSTIYMLKIKIKRCFLVSGSNCLPNNAWSIRSFKNHCTLLDMLERLHSWNLYPRWDHDLGWG